MLVTKFSIDKSKRCTTARLNLRTLLSMQFFTYKVMSKNSGLTHANDSDSCSLWRDVPLHNPLTYMDVFAWKCSHRSTCLHTTCHTISYVVLDRHVSTQCVYYETYSCACSHTERRLSVHFLTYEVMPMCNFKHITLENGRYGHAPIRSDTSIRAYTTADTDTSTTCVGVPATCYIRPGRSLRERSLYTMGGTCRPLATHNLVRSVSFMTD